VVGGPGGNLPALRAISLGNIWDVDKIPTPDLVFELFEPGMVPITASISYAIDGDYSGNRSVSLFDYTSFWRPSFGSTTNLIADGDLNGVVDAADYVTWRNNLNLSAPLPPFAAATGSLSSVPLAVPEPTSHALLFLVCGACSRQWTMNRGRRIRWSRR
jgi:hypothetical protein